MKNLLIATTSFVLLGASAEPPFQEAPAAVVVAVQGAVEVVLGGDRVIPAGGVATIVHASGRTERVTEALTIPSSAGDPEVSAFSRTIRVLASAASTDARGNPNRQGMIRPIPGEPVLIAPRNGLKVLSVRPTFAWHSVEGATGYRIQVRNVEGGMNRYETSDTTWTLPVDAPGSQARPKLRLDPGPLRIGTSDEGAAIRGLGRKGVRRSGGRSRVADRRGSRSLRSRSLDGHGRLSRGRAVL